MTQPISSKRRLKHLFFFLDSHAARKSDLSSLNVSFIAKNNSS